MAQNARNHAVLLARAGWFDVLDDIHGGLCHDLNGRVSSLDGLLQIVQMDGPEETPVISYIEAEAARLADSVRILRTLSGKVDAPPEPLMAGDLAQRALDLHRRHRGLEIQENRLTVEPDTPPFRASPPQVLRILLLVLSHAGRDGREAGVGGVVLAAVAREGRPGFAVTWDHAERAWDAASLEDIREELVQLLADNGGRLDPCPGGVTLTFDPLTRPASGPTGT